MHFYQLIFRAEYESKKGFNAWCLNLKISVKINHVSDQVQNWCFQICSQTKFIHHFRIVFFSIIVIVENKFPKEKRRPKFFVSFLDQKKSTVLIVSGKEFEDESKSLTF